MLKMYVFLAGPSGREPFAATADAAARLARNAVPALAGYTQTRTLADQIEARAEPAYAGAAEFWFEDASDALSASRDPGVLAPLWQDGIAVAAVVVGRERIVMRRPEHHVGGHIKGVFPFRRRPELPVQAFQHYWLNTHGPIAAQTEHALLYAQCHPLPVCYATGSVPFDGITELHWRDVATARAAMRSRQMREVQAADAASFAEPGSVMLFLAEEEHVIPV